MFNDWYQELEHTFTNPSAGTTFVNIFQASEGGSCLKEMRYNTTLLQTLLSRFPLIKFDTFNLIW